MSGQPLCFVLMPLGTKPDPAGRPPIDFDRVYAEAIAPAVEAAGMHAVRAVEEKTDGIIHMPMFDSLLLCEYAVADLTTANANVFYELGVRHAARPSTTQPIFARHQPIPFDVHCLRAMPYDLGENNVFGPEEAEALREALTERLRELRRLTVEKAPVGSPIVQLLGDWKPGEMARLKTDVFRERVAIDEERRERMAAARSKGRDEGVAELGELREELGELDGVGAGVVIDLYLSYRSHKAWTEMVELYEAMPRTLRRQVLVREQLAFALNRRAAAERKPEDRDRALRLLEDVEGDQGPSSETCGLMGRIYKDLWDETRGDEPALAGSHLKKAIDAYVRGFEADPRDAYPGINAVTLLDVRGDEASRSERDRLLPVVRFAVEQRLRARPRIIGTTPPCSSWRCSARTSRAPASTSPRPWPRSARRGSPRPRRAT